MWLRRRGDRLVPDGLGGLVALDDGAAWDAMVEMTHSARLGTAKSVGHLTALEGEGASWDALQREGVNLQPHLNNWREAFFACAPPGRGQEIYLGVFESLQLLADTYQGREIEDSSVRLEAAIVAGRSLDQIGDLHRAIDFALGAR
jgi:hypothetical protein